MINVTIKKNLEPSWISLTTIRSFKRKGIYFHLYIWYWKIRGYEVEVLEE